MRVLRRGSEFTTPRADICLVCPERGQRHILELQMITLGREPSPSQTPQSQW